MDHRIPRSIAVSVLLCAGVSMVVPVSGSSLVDGDIQDILDDLRGLPFDEFIDASYVDPCSDEARDNRAQTAVVGL